ncbi:MAG: ABC transporter permease [Bryobacterales bacterium]|nr:ABC transporter permease [Bryobacterales bacterium]
MISEIRDVETRIVEGNLCLRLELVLEELDGFEGPVVLGWQALDPRTGAYLREGEHRTLDMPGRTRFESVQELTIRPAQLPAGPVRVVVSILAGGGWRYRRGDRYLRLELLSQPGGLQMEAARISALAQEWFPVLSRATGLAFRLPLQTIHSHRSLIRTMVWRDLLGRYRGSFAGVFWSVLNPLLLMATYYFVFGIVLQARFGGDPSREGFVLYFLAGMLPWLPFSEALGRAPGVLVEHATFIKKLVFPVETLPVNLVVSGLVTQGFAILLFLAGLLLFRGEIPAAAMWLPLLLVPQVLLTMGLCWLLSALGLLFRDLGQLMGFLLTVWFFLTPICYPEESVPQAARPVLALNPFLHLVRAFRDTLLEGRAPDWPQFAGLSITAALAFLTGYTVFHKLRRSFPDLL